MNIVIINWQKKRKELKIKIQLIDFIKLKNHLKNRIVVNQEKKIFLCAIERDGLVSFFLIRSRFALFSEYLLFSQSRLYVVSCFLQFRMRFTHYINKGLKEIS